jgi:hypothetical protein
MRTTSEPPDLEGEIRKAMDSGRPFDLQADRPDLDAVEGSAWGQTCTVSGELLAALLTTPSSSEKAPPRGLRLRGARIIGTVDLEGAGVTCPLELRDCWLERAPNLMGARFPLLRLPGCSVPGLHARSLQCDSDLELDSGFVSEGTVDLRQARIGGGLVVSQASLVGGNGVAFDGSLLATGQGMACVELTAHGEVRLAGAHIGGPLIFNGATLSNPNGDALMADGLTVEKAAFLGDGFTALGEVRLPWARVGAQLSFDGGATLSNKGRSALMVDAIDVRGGMTCRRGFVAHGEVRMTGAQIGGGLELDGAELHNPTGTSLMADWLAVEHDLSWPDGLARGEVRLRGARVGGNLNLSQTRFDRSSSELALSADGLKVGRSALWDGIAANGEVRLAGVQIEGQFGLLGAALHPASGWSLFAEYLTVGQAMLCSRGFSATGPVNLAEARVGTYLDSRASWPKELYLNGFTYDTLTAEPEVSPRARLGWIKLDPRGYSPQPYEQLARFYRMSGQEQAARQVMITREWRRRSTLNPFGRLWGYLLYATVGYGYRTWLAGAWIAVLLVLGTRVFSDAYAADQLVAAKADPQQQPAFHPVIYTLDLLLPIVGLGQESAWVPHGPVERWVWVFLLTGWVLTTAVVAGLTGMLKRD